jgi:ABC-type branched-subunit amino acid transport system ATPase component
MTAASTPAPDHAPAAAPAAAPALLELHDVEFAYGSLQVLFGISLTMPVAGRMAILGPNGAGKSTLLNVISGTVPCLRGRILFNGVQVTRMRPEKRARLGMVQVAGGRGTFPTLSVLENLRIGAYHELGDTALVRSRLEQVIELFPVLGARLHLKGGQLSGGEQQMMGLGRALMSGAKLIMVDEFSLGLAPIVVEEIAARLNAAAQLGTSLLVVEQSINVALSLADDIHVLEKGELRFSGSAEELMRSTGVLQEAFFGKAPMADNNGHGPSH